MKKKSELNKLLKVFGPFIKRSQADDPFSQFGALDQEVRTIKHLQGYSDRIKKRFLDLAKEALPIEELLALEVSFDERSEKILTHATTNKFLQSNVTQPYGSLGDNADFGIEVLKEVEVKVEQQVKVKVEQEQEKFIEQEYNLMNAIDGPLIPRPQAKWTPNKANAFLKQLRASGSSKKSYSFKGLGQKVTQLSAIMADPKIFKYQQPYYKAIPGTVFATQNFLMPYKNTILPFFHNLHRLPSQVLNVPTKDGKYCQVLISAYEAKQWKKLIEKGQVKNVWLTQPNLNSLAHAKKELKESKALIKSMLPIALLSGDIAFLAKNMDITKKWLHKKAPSGDKAESAELYQLKRRLAHLAVHTSHTQKQILKNSPLFGTSNLEAAMKQLNIGVLSKQIKLATSDSGDSKPVVAVEPDITGSFKPVDETRSPTTKIEPVSGLSSEPIRPDKPVTTQLERPVNNTKEPTTVTEPTMEPSTKPTTPIKPAKVKSFWSRFALGFRWFFTYVWYIVSWPFKKMFGLKTGKVPKIA